MMEEVRVAHVLIKHTGSQNPVSRRTNLAISLTIEEARSEIDEIRRLIFADPLEYAHSFRRQAENKSDCSSFRNGGDLGFFGRGTMQRPFEDAAFGLQVGDVSSCVSTASGLHLIHRIG